MCLLSATCCASSAPAGHTLIWPATLASWHPAVHPAYAFALIWLCVVSPIIVQQSCRLLSARRRGTEPNACTSALHGSQRSHGTRGRVPGAPVAQRQLVCACHATAQHHRCTAATANLVEYVSLPHPRWLAPRPIYDSVHPHLLCWWCHMVRIHIVGAITTLIAGTIGLLQNETHFGHFFAWCSHWHHGT